MTILRETVSFSGEYILRGNFQYKLGEVNEQNASSTCVRSSRCGGGSSIRGRGRAGVEEELGH